MASIGINATMDKACNSPHIATKEPSQLGTTRSLGTKQASTFVALNVEGQNTLITPQEQNLNKEVENGDGTETSVVKYVCEIWKNGLGCSHCCW